MSATQDAFVARIRRELEAAGDPAKAQPMQDYMKSELPFRGVQAGPRRKLLRAALKAHPFTTRKEWLAAVDELWAQAGFREERYQALETLLAKRYASYRDKRLVPVLERYIVDAAWWDLVDELAAVGLGDLLLAEPAPLSKTLRTWARSRDLWKRRSAIIAQVRRRHDVDTELLYDCIEPNLEDSKFLQQQPTELKFFLRKGIGWALRALAWKDPDEAERYVQQHEERLSGLSKREALKNLEKIRGS